MSEVSRREFVGQMHAYADSVEQDMAKFAALHEDGMLTDAEHEQIQARLLTEHELITEMIAEFRKHI